MDTEIELKRYEVEGAQKWREWHKKIPTIQFRQGWRVQVIPPFSGAMARFVVFEGDYSVSVYLDVANCLGYWDGPYWEAYPNENGDPSRFGMEDTDGLINGIAKSLQAQRRFSEGSTDGKE